MSNIYYQRPNNSDKKNGTEYTGYYHPNYQMPQYNPSNKIVPHPQGYKKDLIANIILILLSITVVFLLIAFFSEIRFMDN